MAISWDEICKRAEDNNKTVICEVEKRRGKHRYFLIKCNLCKTEKESTTDHFNCCFICRKNKKQLCNFLEESKIIHGSKFNYDHIYFKNWRSPVSNILCRICNKSFSQTPYIHFKSYGCKCYKKIFYEEKFLKSCLEKYGNRFNYDLIQYDGMKSKIKIKCNQCNTVFVQRASSHLSDSKGCPKCNESKGENRVARCLSKKNISFIPQKTFNTLRDKNPLFFDFYLDDLELLIEYDGEGHYLPCFGSILKQKQKNLEICQRRDKIKNEWAKANNIPLLRIPYWDFEKVEELVEAFILEHSRCMVE